MDTGLANKRVLVTGGAGGIGSAISRAFASEGAKVAVHYFSSGDAASALAEEIEGYPVHADLTDPDAVDGLFADILSALGGLDIVVTNAGKYPGGGTPLKDMSADRFARTVQDNLMTTFLTARAFMRHAASTESGSLVMVGSTAGTFGESGSADYAAAKGAINTGLLLTLKNEAAQIGDGVRVNAVAPGWTITPKREAQGVAPELIERATATMARKQLASPDDVAWQVVVLASDTLSAHQTGQLVTVAGGMEGRLVP